MRGRSRFTREELEWIRGQLDDLRHAERNRQKRIRGSLRDQGFYISDWSTSSAGFTGTDFEELVRRGAIVRDDTSTSIPLPPRIDDGGFGDMQLRGTDEDGDQASATLAGSPRLSADEALAGGLPSSPGLYALWGDERAWSELDLPRPAADLPLYVGKAEDSLVRRDLRTHFATGRTGASSPRRSLAALLVRQLDLVPIPRRPESPEPGKWTHFALDVEGDRRLTAWMHRHVRISFWVPDDGVFLHDVEHDVIRRWKPPLNLTGVAQPHRRRILRARSAMADAAKVWASERGLVG